MQVKASFVAVPPTITLRGAATITVPLSTLFDRWGVAWVLHAGTCMRTAMLSGGHVRTHAVGPAVGIRACEKHMSLEVLCEKQTITRLVGRLWSLRPGMQTYMYAFSFPAPG